MHPELFKIGSISVHAYGFMVAVAFLAGLAVSLSYARKEGIRPEYILEAAILIMLASIVGSRLLFVIIHWGYFLNHPSEIAAFRKGGLAFLGGLLAALLVLFLYARARGIPFLKLLDLLSPGTSLGYAIARVGCFLSGCCFGLPTTLPWGVRFPFGSPAHARFQDRPLHPAQLYSLAAMFAIFLILRGLSKRKKTDGFLFLWWVFLYGLYRFPVEFLRYNEIHWHGLTPSQWIVLVPALGAGFMLFRKSIGAGR